MKKLNNLIFPFNTIVCALAIPAIIFIVFVLKWLPCPMCLLQQLCILTTLVLSLFCWINHKRQFLTIILRVVLIITIAYGIYVAGSQVHLQYFSTPATVASCSDTMNPFLIQATNALTGTVKSCSELNETVAGLSLAVYSLAFFIFLLVINSISLFINLFKRSKAK